MLLNPKEKIVKTVQSKINVMDILDTRLYAANKETKDFWVTASKVAAEEKEKFEAEMEDCCQKTLTNEGKKCCKSNKDKLLDMGPSQVQLEVVKRNLPMTRHEKRFGITFFVYTSRRRFHPARQAQLILEPYFVEPDFMDDSEEADENKISAEEKEVRLKALQKTAAEKQKRRKEGMGDLLRSKGFIWLATSNTLMGGWQQVSSRGRLKDGKYFHHDLRSGRECDSYRGGDVLDVRAEGAVGGPARGRQARVQGPQAGRKLVTWGVSCNDK